MSVLSMSLLLRNLSSWCSLWLDRVFHSCLRWKTIFQKASNILIFKDRLMCMGLHIFTMCLRVSSFSIFLQAMSTSVYSLLPSNFQSLQSAVSSFTVSLCTSQSRSDRWSLPFIKDMVFSLFGVLEKVVVAWIS